MISTCERVVLAGRPGRHHYSPNRLLHEDQSLICSSVVRMLGFQKSLWIHDIEEILDLLVGFWHMMLIHSSKHSYESLQRFS